MRSGNPASVAVAPASGRIISRHQRGRTARPPGGGYRRVVTAVAAVLLAIVMGQMVNGISAFFAPLKAGFGWTRADTSLVNAAGVPVSSSPPPGSGTGWAAISAAPSAT